MRMALYKLLESGRINFLLFVFKLTKSEKIYNKVVKLTEKRIQKLQGQTIKSRWEKVQLQNELKNLNNK